jgi:hypothetical protein
VSANLAAPAVRAARIVSWLRFFAMFILAGFALAACYHTAMRHFLNRGFPWNTYLFDPSDRFNDWHNPVRDARSMDPYYKYRTANYFPFAYMAFLSAAHLSWLASTLLYLSLSVSLLTVAVGVFWKLHIVRVIDKGAIGAGFMHWHSWPSLSR